MSTLTPRLEKLSRNAIINGNMDFAQRGPLALSGTGDVVGLGADRWKTATFGNGTLNFSTTTAQETAVPTQAQSGFQSTYCLKFTNVTNAGSITGNTYYIPYFYHVEGYDYQPYHGKTVTFSFWFQASITGTYSFALRNNDNTRSYVTTFTVNSASTWEQKIISVALDTTSSGYDFTNSTGLSIFIGSLAPSTGQGTTTLNTWLSGNYFAAASATQYNTTAGSILRLAQVQMVEGTVAPVTFNRCGSNIQEELAMCQRYCQFSPVNGGYITAIMRGGTTNTVLGQYISLTTTMRTAPTALNAPTVFVSAAPSLVTHVAIYNSATSAYTTITGSFGDSSQYQADGYRLIYTASGQFNGTTAGYGVEIYIGPRLLFSAEL